MKFKLLIIVFLVLTCGMFSSLKAEDELLLRDNLNRAKAGDYLVTAQNKNYSILIIRSKEG